MRELLPQPAAQTRQPDEIIIVDGGSIDGTLSAIEGFTLPKTWVETIVAHGVNVAGGLNAGVLAVQNELIARTDAGCYLVRTGSPNFVAA